MYNSFDFDYAEIVIKLQDGTEISALAGICSIKIERDLIDISTIGSQFAEYINGPSTIYLQSILSDVKVGMGSAVASPKTKRLLRMIDG